MYFLYLNNKIIVDHIIYYILIILHINYIKHIKYKAWSKERERERNFANWNCQF